MSDKPKAAAKVIPRSEEEIVSQADIVVILGGEEYRIKPLVIRDSREWRKKVIDLVAPLPGLVSITMDDKEGFAGALKEMLVVMPDQVLEHFFEYAKDLNRDEIEGKATDAELAKAFEAVMVVAFPLAASLPKELKRLSQ